MNDPFKENPQEGMADAAVHHDCDDDDQETSICSSLQGNH